jgi:hypothetical protein
MRSRDYYREYFEGYYVELYAKNKEDIQTLLDDINRGYLHKYYDIKDKETYVQLSFYENNDFAWYDLPKWKLKKDMYFLFFDNGQVTYKDMYKDLEWIHPDIDFWARTNHYTLTGDIKEDLFYLYKRILKGYILKSKDNTDEETKTCILKEFKEFYKEDQNQRGMRSFTDIVHTCGW